MENKMFCFQCQETAGCKGCTQVGVCGKKPEVAAMQDLLIYVTKGLSAVTTRLRAEGKPVSREVNHLVTENLFITITNANFDREAIIKAIETTLTVKACRKQRSTMTAAMASMRRPRRSVSSPRRMRMYAACASSRRTASRVSPLMSSTLTPSSRRTKQSMHSSSRLLRACSTTARRQSS